MRACKWKCVQLNVNRFDTNWNETKQFYHKLKWNDNKIQAWDNRVIDFICLIANKINSIIIHIHTNDIDRMRFPRMTDANHYKQCSIECASMCAYFNIPHLFIISERKSKVYLDKIWLFNNLHVKPFCMCSLHVIPLLFFSLVYFDVALSLLFQPSYSNTLIYIDFYIECMTCFPFHRWFYRSPFLSMPFTAW